VEEEKIMTASKCGHQKYDERKKERGRKVKKEREGRNKKSRRGEEEEEGGRSDEKRKERIKRKPGGKLWGEKE